MIIGLDVLTWGEVCHMSAHNVVGYLAASLDVLVDFYAGPERRARIRMAEIEPLTQREAAD